MKYLRQLLFAVSIGLIAVLVWNDGLLKAQGPDDRVYPFQFQDRLEQGAAGQSGQAKLLPVTDRICTNGEINTGLLAPNNKFFCANVDLLAWLPLSEIGADLNPTFTPDGNGNDSWGWTDPTTGDEYFIIAHSGGTTFIDITTPTAPVIVGLLPPNAPYEFGHVWGDVKVFSDAGSDTHALYHVTEATGEGMQVFDLTQLRTATPVSTLTAATVYTGFGSAHNIALNQDSGFVYAVGTDFDNLDVKCPNLGGNLQGGLHMIDISNPFSPTHAGCFNDEGYLHDTACFNYPGPDADHIGKEICFNSNGDQFLEGVNRIDIVDVTNKLSPILISSVSAPTSLFTHQAWPTDDFNYLLMDDEVDEWEFANLVGFGDPVVGTHTYIFDIQDLDNPSVLDPYISGNTSLDHNQYVDGNLVYQANYASGLRIVDITGIGNPDGLREGAFFDTFPESDINDFFGAWSVYPFFGSGVIGVSDAERGAFILQPQPGFRLVPTPPGGPLVRPPAYTHEMCVNGSAVYTIDVVSFLGFGGNVNLSTGGAPTNGSANLGSGTVAAGNSTNLTVNAAATTPTGSYEVTVSGDTGANDSQTISLPIDVLDVPATPTLLTPTNTITGVSVKPTLEWTDASPLGNITYTVEIATDMSFTTVVYSATVSNQTTHKVATPLDFETQYYWRIRESQNVCGTGSASTAFTFTTGPQATYLPIIMKNK